MNNLIVYYLSIFVPLFALIGFSDQMPPWLFLSNLVFYFVVYRTVTDYYRLRSKGIFVGKNFWSMLIPGIRYRYFRDLYWF